MRIQRDSLHHHAACMPGALPCRLVAGFGLDAMDEKVKRFPLAHPGHPGELGVLSVYRYMNKQDLREVLFYELTWDSIVDEQKSIIDFDNGRESSSRRVPFNHTMKTFVNQSVPDALIYNTDRNQGNILAMFPQRGQMNRQYV